MYWAFTTLATVGYGDISATTVAERIYAIFAQIVGGFVFSGAPTSWARAQPARAHHIGGNCFEGH